MLAIWFLFPLVDPMDCRPPGSSAHGISQSRILEWVAMSISRGSSQPKDWTLSLLCFLHWQEDSLPLYHLGSPYTYLTLFWANKHPSLWDQSSRVFAVSLPLLCPRLPRDVSSMWNVLSLLWLTHIWPCLCLLSISLQSSLIAPFSEFLLNWRPILNSRVLNSSLITSCSKCCLVGRPVRISRTQYMSFISLELHYRA